MYFWREKTTVTLDRYKFQNLNFSFVFFLQPQPTTSNNFPRASHQSSEPFGDTFPTFILHISINFHTLFFLGFFFVSFVSNMSKRVGQIQLIIGPMYAGKTSELLRRIRRYTIANRSCAVIKYRKDTRFSEDNMATHDKYATSSRSIAHQTQANVGCSPCRTPQRSCRPSGLCRSHRHR